VAKASTATVVTMPGFPENTHTNTALFLFLPGVYEFLQNGKIAIDHPDFRNLNYKKSLIKMLSHSSTEEAYTHSFKVSVHNGPYLQYFIYFKTFKWVQ
jgi:hypothetical protein